MPHRSRKELLSGLEEYLAGLEHLGLYRRTPILDSRNKTEITINGKAAVNFCSNDYLGLASHPRIIKQAQNSMDRYGVGSGASQMVCGKFDAHRILEERLADLTGRDKVILFSSGYLANLAALSTLAAARDDRIYMDRFCHGSLVDGALLARGKIRRYNHADMSSLESFIRGPGSRKLVVTDTVFSMDGDLAPLPALAELSVQYGGLLYIDDAHGFGVLGKNGYGAGEHFELDQDALPLMMATFGKALGTQGAFIAGEKTLVETIRQRARPYIFTTSLPPAMAAATVAALEVLRDEPERRAQLFERLNRFKAAALEENLPLVSSPTPIQPIIVGDADTAVTISGELLDKGFFVSAIRPPTVPADTARLRVTICPDHTPTQVDNLVGALAELFYKHGLLQ